MRRRALLRSGAVCAPPVDSIWVLRRSLPWSRHLSDNKRAQNFSAVIVFCARKRKELGEFIKRCVVVQVPALTVCEADPKSVRINA